MNRAVCYFVEEKSGLFSLVVNALNVPFKSHHPHKISYER